MNPLRRYPLIFNPKARGQRGQRTLRFLMDHATRFALYATGSSEEARDIAAEFADNGEPVVIAAGGGRHPECGSAGPGGFENRPGHPARRNHERLRP